MRLECFHEYFSFNSCILLAEFIITRLFGSFALMFYFNCEHFLKQKTKKILQIKKKEIVDFQNFQKGKFLKIGSSINLPWGRVRSHTKFGPYRFSRFDVYWIQTNTQANCIYGGRRFLILI